MSRSDIDGIMQEIDKLIDEINQVAPADSSSYMITKFRADLACLLVVAIAATYETCVKEILYSGAKKHHAAFGEFAKRNFSKINSKIRVGDLKSYCKLYHPEIDQKFRTRLSERKTRILERSGQNIENAYETILSWRHDFAHAGIRNTTIEEATLTHMLAKRIIYTFDSAFN